MAVGDQLSGDQRHVLDETIRAAEQLCRAEFSVFIGDASAEPRSHATRLHNSLVAPARSVLILVDPERRVLEVVTGGYVRQSLTDSEVESAVETMRAAFAQEDLIGGLQRGIMLLAEDAVGPGEKPPAE